ncbi:hypothetical protein D3C72_598310 [compost metagenome]
MGVITVQPTWERRPTPGCHPHLRRIRGASSPLEGEGKKPLPASRRGADCRYSNYLPKTPRAVRTYIASDQASGKALTHCLVRSSNCSPSM